MAPGTAAFQNNPVAHGRVTASGSTPDLGRQPRDERVLAAARRQRAELLHEIHLFEGALAVPAGDPSWRQGVAEQLGALRHAVTEQVVVTEGTDGLYAEVLDDAPRLAHTVEILVREQAALVAAVDTLSARLKDASLAAELVRGWASDLLRELSRHRQRGADLVYEAYATDIGGET